MIVEDAEPVSAGTAPPPLAPSIGLPHRMMLLLEYIRSMGQTTYYKRRRSMGMVSQNPANPILLTAVNDPYKIDYDRFLDVYSPAFDARYNTIAATSGTKDILEKHLPHKRFIDLGHGPEWGDIRAANFILDQWAAGRRIEALTIINPSGQLHWDAILVLMSSLVCVFR